MPALWPDVGSDQRVDADHFAVPVQQRPAGIAGVDGRIGLDGFVNLHAVRFLHRADRTDDAAGHGPGKAERIADGINFLSDLQIARVAEHHRGESRAFDLNDRQIVRAVGAHHRGPVLLAVVQRDFHLAGLGDHVIVGQHVTFFIDNEARALPFLRHQAIEEIEGHGARSDVHHRIDVLAIDARCCSALRRRRTRPKRLR